MTEAEWLASVDPKPMLTSLPRKVSERKLRLFVCACCRRIWDHINDSTCRKAVEVGERYADGLIRLAELREAAQAAEARINLISPPMPPPLYAALGTVMVSRLPDSDSRVPYRKCAIAAAGSASFAVRAWDLASFFEGWRTKNEELLRIAEESNQAGLQAWRMEAQSQASLVRDIFGYQFRPSRLRPGWLRWNDGTVVKIAQAIYDEHRFEDMPILADALEDAGCDNAAILAHCRQPCKHVRGCWVVDLLLGKS